MCVSLDAIFNYNLIKIRVELHSEPIYHMFAIVQRLIFYSYKNICTYMCFFGGNMWFCTLYSFDGHTQVFCFACIVLDIGTRCVYCLEFIRAVDVNRQVKFWRVVEIDLLNNMCVCVCLDVCMMMICEYSGMYRDLVYCI